VASAGLSADDEDVEAAGLAGCGPVPAGPFLSSDWPVVRPAVPGFEEGKLEPADSGNTCQFYRHHCSKEIRSFPNPDPY
jgi:hypothetical protein